MSTATATQPHAGFVPGGTITGMKAFILRERPETNKRFAERAAHKLMKMRTVSEFYRGLSVLGIHTDSTARDAEHRMTCMKLECNKCGRTSVVNATRLGSAHERTNS